MDLPAIITAIVALYGAVLSTYTLVVNRKDKQRQIDATDHEIDRLVYDLYGLTEEEIGIVEGRA